MWSRCKSSNNRGSSSRAAAQRFTQLIGHRRSVLPTSQPPALNLPLHSVFHAPALRPSLPPLAPVLSPQNLPPSLAVLPPGLSRWSSSSCPLPCPMTSRSIAPSRCGTQARHPHTWAKKRADRGSAGTPMQTCSTQVAAGLTQKGAHWWFWGGPWCIDLQQPAGASWVGRRIP